MNAPDTFDRERGGERHRAAADLRPLADRAWFRLGGMTFIMSWVAACIAMTTWLLA